MLYNSVNLFLLKSKRDFRWTGAVMTSCTELGLCGTRILISVPVKVTCCLTTCCFPINTVCISGSLRWRTAPISTWITSVWAWLIVIGEHCFLVHRNIHCTVQSYKCVFNPGSIRYWKECYHYVKKALLLYKSFYGINKNSSFLPKSFSVAALWIASVRKQQFRWITDKKKPKIWQVDRNHHHWWQSTLIHNMTYLLKTRTMKPSIHPLLGNGFAYMPVSRQQIRNIQERSKWEAMFCTTNCNRPLKPCEHSRVTRFSDVLHLRCSENHYGQQHSLLWISGRRWDTYSVRYPGTLRFPHFRTLRPVIEVFKMPNDGQGQRTQWSW